MRRGAGLWVKGAVLDGGPAPALPAGPLVLCAVKLRDFLLTRRRGLVWVVLALAVGNGPLTGLMAGLAQLA